MGTVADCLLLFIKKDVVERVDLSPSKLVMSVSLTAMIEPTDQFYDLQDSAKALGFTPYGLGRQIDGI